MKQKRKKFLPEAVGNMLWGLLISWITTMIICLVGAAMITTGSIGEEHGIYCTLAALMLGSFVGAIPARFKSESRYGIWCLAQGAVFYGSLLLMGTILFDGRVTGAGVTALVTLGASAITALLGRRGKKGLRNVRRRYKIGAIV